MDTEFTNFIQEVKQKTDIINIIEEYLDLKRVGKNYQALCPFHQEKTPSFTVNPENQVYHCFGCGAGGDVFTFLMEIDSLTFIESLKILARRQSMELPSQTDYQRQNQQKRERMFAANDFAARFYHYILINKSAAGQARKYLEQRGFNEKTITKFQLGYAPDRWQVLLDFLTDKGYSQQELVNTGLISKSSKGNYFDKFRDRIIFPIKNIRGEVLAFGGRKLAETTPEPKYLNSPATLIFDKSKNLYGLNRAKANMRKEGTAIIMEGYTDVLRAHQEGVTNAVASLGTAFTGEQARVFSRFSDQVYIAFDADEAGNKAALKGLDILKKEGLQVKVISLPQGQDPDDYIAEEGVEAFLALKDNALGLVDFKIKAAVDNHQTEDPGKKVGLLKKIIKILAEIEDAVEREVYLQKVARDYQIDMEVLKSEIKKIKFDKKDKKRQQRYTKTRNSEPPVMEEVDRLQKNILKAFIEFPEFRKIITKTLDPDNFSKQIRSAVRFLWNNQKQPDFYSLLRTAEDNINDSQRKFLLNLSVTENLDINQSILQGWLVNYKRKLYLEKKRRIYQQLQQISKEISPETLNEQLLNYKKVHSAYRREDTI